MIVHISSDAEADVAQGYWFYEQQADRLGDYFRDCILADIDSLNFYAGIHEIAYGYHRMLAKTFPFAIYYKLQNNEATVVAVLDARRDPSWTRDRLS
jgi:plasmid stabilization system protein ParE